MGTLPRVKIEAATLAGGSNNQDRYAYGSDWAFVLDGATSFAPTNTHQDGGWYAERLCQSLSNLLRESSADTPDIIAQAIKAAASLFEGRPSECPTSTIALARWNDELLESYLLGDSTLAIITTAGNQKISTDDRITHIRADLRDQYRKRLQVGGGFDDNHRAILAELQTHQSSSRNRPGGYWIAASEPAAAYHGIHQMWPRDSVAHLALATDGAALAVTSHTVGSWVEMIGDSENSLKAQHCLECRDPNGSRLPRSKLHDDKTLVVAHFDKPETTQT